MRTTSFRHAVALALAAVVVEVSQCHAQCHVCNGECYADETDSAETPPFLHSSERMDSPKKHDKIDLKAKYVYMFVSSKGVRWTLAPYSLFAGCYGILSVTIEWKDLEPFAAEPHSERR